MKDYAVNKLGEVIKRLEDGHTWTSSIYSTEQNLGDGDFIQKGDYRCYKYVIENDVPVQRQIKRYGVVDQYNDIVGAVYYHEKKDGTVEIDDNIDVFHPSYGIPQYHLDGSIVKKKSNMEDREELKEKAKEIKDAVILNQIESAYKPSKEMEIVKAYIDWIVDGKPNNDQRETDYNEMQTAIFGIKNA